MKLLGAIDVAWKDNQRDLTHVPRQIFLPERKQFFFVSFLLEDPASSTREAVPAQTAP